jgi:hypothetical protein
LSETLLDPALQARRVEDCEGKLLGLLKERVSNKLMLNVDAGPHFVGKTTCRAKFCVALAVVPARMFPGATSRHKGSVLLPRHRKDELHPRTATVEELGNTWSLSRSITAVTSTSMAFATMKWVAAPMTPTQNT